MKLNKKLIILFLLVSIIPIVVLSWVTISDLSKDLITQEENAFGSIIDSRASDINHLIQLRQEQAKLIAGTFLPRQLDSSGVNDPEDIQKIQEHIDSIYDEIKLEPTSSYDQIDKLSAIQIIGIWDVSGIIVANTEKDLIGEKMPDEFLQGVKQQGTYFGGFQQDPLTGENFLIILESIRDWEDGKFAGVILLKVKAQILNEIISNQEGLKTTGEAYLINEDYFFITESRFVDDAILNVNVESETTKRCFAGENFFGEWSNYQGIPVFGSVLYLKDQNWCFIVEVTLEELYLPVIELQTQIIMISSIMIVGVVIVSIFFSRTISLPIKKLGKNMEDIREGKFDFEIDPKLRSSNNEIGELAHGFEKMRQYVKTTHENFDELVSAQTEKLENSKNQLKENVHELQEQKTDLDYFKNALDESSLVAITDKEGTITYVNKKFEEVSKYSKEELIGQNHRILKSGYHPPAFFDGLWKTISSGKVWKADIKNIAKDGSYYWVKTVIIPFLDKDGKPEQYMAVRTDITKQKENEEKLKDAVTELKKSDLLKEEFSSMVTHELKTPLTPIRGYCEMLKDESFGTLTNDQLNYIEKINSSAVLLERLIGDVLDVQKLDMERMSFNKQSLDIDDFLDKLKQDCSHLMKEKGIEFIVTDSLKTSIKTDQLRLRQIFENLIRNSVDFVPTKNGKIEVNVKQENGKMVFHIKDNGVGIPKEKQKNIFKKFYQVDTSHTRKHGGTGLGLVICKGIVKGLGGEIWFESEPGKGTIFSFDLPLEGN